MEKRLPAAEPPARLGSGSEGDKGPETGALGFLSNVRIGVCLDRARLSPAAGPGFVAIEASGFVPRPDPAGSPSSRWLFISAADDDMNRADPYRGTLVHLG